MYIIGVDIGTTSTKAVLFDNDGNALAREEKQYPLLSPVKGSAEQDSDEIADACFHCIRELIRSRSLNADVIEAISFSAVMHSLVITDASGKPKTPLITWADERSSDKTNQLKETYGLRFYERTGTPLHPMSPLAKLAWITAGNAPWDLTADDHVLSIKDYVFYRLFGTFVTDESVASSSGLYDLYTRTWNKEALDAAGVKEHQLPTIMETTSALRGLDTAIANDLGVHPETPFVLGASDGVLANLGADADVGDTVVTIGTSGAIRAIVASPVTHEQGHTFCYHLTADAFVIGGAINNGGVALQWTKEHLFKEAYEGRPEAERDVWFEELAKQAPIGCEGLLCLPYLYGERAPYWTTGVTGGFVGMSSRNEQPHFARAVYEGVMYQMNLMAQDIAEMVPENKQLLVNGGFVRSSFWVQMMADILEREIIVPEHHDASSKGAAMLARNALNKPPFEKKNGKITSYKPDKEQSVLYEQAFTKYKKWANAMLAME